MLTGDAALDADVVRMVAKACIEGEKTLEFRVKPAKDTQEEE